MDKALSPAHWADTLRREWQLRHLSDPRYGFIFRPAPENEWVSLSCACSGYDVETDVLLSVCAVPVVGRRVLTSERLELLIQPAQPVPEAALRRHRLRMQDLAGGLALAQAVPRLLQFLGSRRLIGYYLEFDIAMLNRVVRPLTGVKLPQPQIEISSMYYAHKFQQLQPYQQQAADVDLRFSSMISDLGLPGEQQGTPLDDAVISALAFLKLRELLGQ